MNLVPRKLRSLLTATLASALTLTVACAQEDPFADLREEKEKDTDNEDTESKDSGDEGSGTGATQDQDDSKGNSTSTGQGDSEGSPTTDEPTPSTTGSDETGTPSGTETTGTETVANPYCEKLPTKLAVLGDFTPAGRAPANGPDDPANGFKMLHQHLVDTYGLNALEYQNVADAGDSTKFVATDTVQKAKIDAPQSGHLFVYIHSGSNDLKDFAFALDSKAESDFDGKWNETQAALESILAHFRDPAKFPGGVTIGMNNLFNPFDDCTETVVTGLLTELAPPNSATKMQLFARFNEKLETYAKANDIHLNDYHDAFLGHGHNRDNDKCPHHDRAGELWLKGGKLDDDHAIGNPEVITDINLKGHQGLGKTMSAMIDSIYAGCS